SVGRHRNSTRIDLFQRYRSEPRVETMSDMSDTSEREIVRPGAHDRPLNGTATVPRGMQRSRLSSLGVRSAPAGIARRQPNHPDRFKRLISGLAALTVLAVLG